MDSGEETVESWVERPHNHRMNPTGPIGPRSIGAFASAAGLAAK